MRVFKSSYRDRHGATQATSKWYVEFRDHNEVLRRYPAFTNRAQSEDLGRKLERLVVTRVTGEAPDLAQTRWVESMPSALRQKLATIGLLDSRRLAASQSLTEHLRAFKQSILDKGSTSSHAEQTRERARKLFEGCGFVYWSDLDPSRVERFLATMREGDSPIGAQTSNYYLASAKHFGRWMVQSGRASESPLRVLRPLNARKAPQRSRRPLKLSEARGLLRAAQAGPERFGMPGPERALVYALALETGLRAGELKSLRGSDFQLDGPLPTVTVRAAYSKNRREDPLPLRPDTVRTLRSHLADRHPTALAFGLHRVERTAQLVRKDLEAAGFDYETDAGVADFHALRHTFLTNLARAGVHPKTAQTLARHSTISLTLDRYTHTLLGDEAHAVSLLPDLNETDSSPLAATGTESLESGRSVSASCLTHRGVQSRTPVDSDGRSRHAEGVSAPGEVAEPVDAADLKSAGPRPVGVRVPPSPPDQGVNVIW
jgi:integrase